MKRIKQLVFTSCNSLILLLISFLGFTTSCQKDEPVLMYGSPHATFIINGNIASAAGSKSIQDIIVQMRYVPEEDSSKSMLVETGFSDGVGSYHLATYGEPHDQTFRLRFIDTDGPLNGEYETLDTTVIFKDPDFVKGDASWYRGYVEKTLDVKLKPKE